MDVVLFAYTGEPTQTQELENISCSYSIKLNVGHLCSYGIKHEYDEAAIIVLML